MATDKRNQTAAPDAAATQATKSNSDVVNDITRLEVARSLPEITGDAKTEQPQVAEGAIERFIAGEDDRRVMAIVAYSGGLASVHIADGDTEN